MGEFVAVAKASEVPAGGTKAVNAKGRDIGLFNVGGTVYAMDGVCKHAGGPLGEGELDGSIVTCPLHGWQYDVCSGQCKTAPGLKQQQYNVKVEGGTIFVEV